MPLHATAQDIESKQAAIARKRKDAQKKFSKGILEMLGGEDLSLAY